MYCVKQIGLYEPPVADPETHCRQQNENGNRLFIRLIVCDALH